VTAFVLDNSVVMRWCFEDTTTPYAETVLQKLSTENQAFVPILWQYEVGAVLAKAQRTGIITRQKAADFIDTLADLAIIVDRTSADVIFTDVQDLAVTYRITGYDAAYLEVALRKNLPLASLDEELCAACLSAGGVIFEP
jgi:predicted nucleic acid-binding protein